MKLGQEPLARAAFAPLPKPKVLIITWPLVSFLERFPVKLLPKGMNLKIIMAVITVLTGCQALDYTHTMSHSILNP